MSDTVDKIKERLSIVDVVGGYVKLVRAGKYWKGLSPFTKEKTPSFFVTPEKGFYHCFSTGKGGDMFTFVEEMEGVDFKGALKILAEKAGVELVRESQESRDERDGLYAVIEAATAFFASELEERADARAYLEKRGLTTSTIAHWRLGYARKDWRALKAHLEGRGFTESLLLKAGLIKRPDSGEGKEAYDRFRGRIMFPIFDASGRPIAFSGRIFEDNPENPQAKYLNSPEGPLFDKSRALYGIQDAKSAIRTLGFSMLVEGQLDLLMSHQAGYRSAVATSGTACTASHAEILKRYSENVLLAYDGDVAGVNATHRAAELLLATGMNVKVVSLPEGADPADVLLTNPDGFKDAVRRAEPAVDFFLSYLVRSVSDERKRKSEVGKIVLPLVALIHNALDQSHFVKRVAETIGAPEEAVNAELKKIHRGGGVSAPGADPFFSPDQHAQFLFGILLSFEDAGDPRATRVESLIMASFGPERLAALRASSDSEQEAARIIASEQFVLLYPEPGAQEEFLQELEREAASLNRSGRSEYERLTRALKAAEESGNRTEAERLLAELGALSKKLE